MGNIRGVAVNGGQTFLFNKWFAGGWDLLFPPSCTVCNALLHDISFGLCRDCRADIDLICSPLCHICGRELSDSADGDHYCGMCLGKRPLYSSARGVAHYKDPVATLLHRLKYKGDYTVLPALMSIIKMQDCVVLGDGDRIIPVPLHFKRLQYRGFNQATLLARLFFPDNKKSLLIDVLQRVRHTNPQAGLDGIVRRKNLRHAFAVRNAEQIQGRNLVLVDDVFTTGTTVSECSRVLLAAGAKTVHVVTLARVDK